MEETGLVLRPFVSAWAVLALGAIVATLSVLAYARTTRPVSRRFRRLLLALRLIAVAAATVALLRPSLQTTRHELVKRPLLVLVDRSRSMSEIRDTPGGATRLEAVDRMIERNKETLDALGDLYDVSLLAFGKHLLKGTGPPDAASTSYSAYGLAIQEAFSGVANGQADGVVIIGDGAHNLDPPDPLEVASALNEQGVPLYCVGVGEEQDRSGLRDVRVRQVEAPKTAYVFTSFPVRSQVYLRGCQGLTVKVRLEVNGEPAQEKDVRVAHLEEVVPIEFEVTPEDVGDLKLTVRALPVPDEVLLTNNAASTYVRVASEGVRVGYFDTLRPESKFIARALAGAEHVALRRTLLLPGQPLPPDQSRPDRYDVVILGDLGASAMRPSWMAALRKAVLEDGKGLVVLFAQGPSPGRALTHTALEDVLPIKLGSGLRAQGDPVQFVVVPAQAGHPIVALAPTGRETLALWAAMPRLAGSVVGAEPKRGATVLARDERGNALLVVQRAGAGRVACMLGDTTFRWFFTEQDTQDQHRRFWRQMVLWAGGRKDTPEARMRLELSKQRVLLDEKVGLSVYLTDRAGQPVRDAAISVRVLDPRGDATEVPLSFSREEAAYVGHYSPVAEGDHTVDARAERDRRLLGAEQAHFRVSGPSIELEDPFPNLSLLRRMAAATQESGGRYYPLAQADDLLKGLLREGTPLNLTIRQRSDVWDSWLLFALFTACLVAEWGLRKWKGLL